MPLSAKKPPNSKEGERLPWFKVFREDLIPKGKYSYMDAGQLGFFIYLTEMADGDGNVPDCSVNKLAQQTKLNRRTVAKYIAFLKSKGAIYMEKTDAYHFTVLLPQHHVDQYERYTDKPSRVAKAGMRAIEDVKDQALADLDFIKKE